MPWDGSGFLSGAVNINYMIAALTKKLTAIRFDVMNKFASFHAIETQSGSKITSCF